MSEFITRRRIIATLAAVSLTRLRADERIRPGAGSRYLAGPCMSATSKIRIAGPGEPGEPMIVTGRVYRPDGQATASGVIMYAYQTDLTGEYRNEGNGAPRLRGWMKTDAQGRYEYRTIRPGAYPSRNQASHVHYQFWSADVPPQWAMDLLFEDDPLVKESERRRSAAAGTFAFVSKPRLHGGILYVTQDFRLKPAADDFEDNIMHGLRPCLSK